MIKKYVYIFLGLSFFIFAAMIFRPVPIPKDAEDCLVAEGKVVSVYAGGPNDIKFRLEGDKTTYYINRGLEYGLVLEDLQKELTGNMVKIRYPKYWTPLDPNNSIKHLCILEYNGSEIFNEIELVH